ncbi:Transmembrane amino acid transporter protein [Trichomonas vaginalis G3]|uniref:Transmembrane amino acid transporter protein n=1 Tax=Trichomonas vaginalis (strain ATCC PRA-98 / G3) TaxID=412133 RepID=A2D794_TRIV3|nr:amino acid transmembrane transporter protein [Trichomonas vaginalis G3]EAY23611.1 Transmembrane amino acid transporter protein [Trichomonas vaginalis G3]KAI5490104.1 amino acid transmembrane transporter protein [Trichomonas vaginalis G3]|eukprot:XP_001276859.1 Transmembrane amino acid transporter protein [Trichomonas vaginalis G3]
MDDSINLEDVDDFASPPPVPSSDIGLDGQPTFVPNDAILDDSGVERPDEIMEDVISTAPDGTPQEPEKPTEPVSEHGTVRRFATILNLLNSLLGAGILGVPGSMTHVGLVPSVLIIILIAVLSHIATLLTIKLQRRVGAEGFDDLAYKVFGKFGSISLSIMIMLFSYSCNVAYLVIGTDSVVSFFRMGKIILNKIWQRAIVTVILWAVFPGALTFLKDITFLQYASFINFGCVTFFVIAMIVKTIQILPKEGVSKDITFGTFGIGIFSAISIYGLAFALPVVVLPIIEPYNKNIRKRGIVSLWSFILCCFFVAVPGILCYLMLGSEAGSNVLNAFAAKDPKDYIITVVQAAFLIVVCCSYPAVAQSLICSWAALIFKVDSPKVLSTPKRLICVAMANVIPLGLAMFLPNVGPALSIGGAFGGCLADFFFPPAMWVKISKKPISHWQNILNIIFAIFGIICCIIATTLAIIDCIKAFK